MNSLLLIAQQFISNIEHITPLGHGLINDTYLVKTTHQTIVLQKINSTIFSQPNLIIENLATLTHFTAKQSNTLALQLPKLLVTLNNKSYYCDDNGNYWRALSYIDNSYSLLKINTIEQAAQIGFALGYFHRLLSELPLNLLHTTLADFHITPVYLEKYRQIINQSFIDNIDSNYCAEFIARYAFISDELEKAKAQSLLKLRVIHGDPKADNFLFDKDTHQVISLIDLDTVQAGLVHYDIGDCIRSCCQTNTGEFDIRFCEVILKNYLAQACYFFTKEEYDFLYCAIRLLPFELGLRFYTDYLQGNVYFKVSSPEQNLQRAKQQFNLCQDIIRKEKLIKLIIAQFSNQL